MAKVSQQGALLRYLNGEDDEPVAAPYQVDSTAGGRLPGQVRTAGKPGNVTQLPGSGGAITDTVVSGGAALAPAVTGLFAKAPLIAKTIPGTTVGAGAGGSSLASGAAGMGIGAGAALAGDWLGGKLKPKEEMPTYGGQHGAITDSYGRRFEGTGPGVAGGAVRGLGYGANPALLAATGGLSAPIAAGIGALVGAFTKNAPSAFSDFNKADAADAITRGYQTYLGREPEAGVVDNRLAAQGLKPGDRWVGEKGLFGQLDEIKNSPEAQAYASGGNVPGVPTVRDTAGGFTPEGAAQAPVPISMEASQKLIDYYAGDPQRRAARESELSMLRATQGGNKDVRAPVADAQNAEYDALLKSLGLGGQGKPTVANSLAGLLGGQSGFVDPQMAADALQNSTTPAAGGGGQVGQYALEGFDAGKLASGHDSPKYQVGRILSKYPPTPEGLRQALPELQALGLGDVAIAGSKGDKLTFSGNVDPRFEGVTTFDVIRAAGEGGKGWQWLGDGAGGDGAASSGAPSASAGSASPSLDSLGSGSLEAILAALSQIATGPNDPKTLQASLLRQLTNAGA